MIQIWYFYFAENTKTIFIGNVHLGLEKNRDSNERVLKPLNFIFILFLFPDLPIEGVFLKKSIKVGKGTSLRNW